MQKLSSTTFLIALIFGAVLFIACERNDAPDTASKPSGPDIGWINVIYDFATSSTDPNDDSIAYQFNWGDGTLSDWSNFVSNGTSITLSKSWPSAGTYWVKAKAKDTKDAISDWSDGQKIIILANNPPNIPLKPNGPDHGNAGVAYNFTTSSTDPDGDSVACQFAWGDGDTTSWSNFVASGATIIMSKSWSAVGTYLVRARAKDIKGAVSTWSSEQQITISMGGNNSPNNPSMPSGPDNGNVGISYDFVTSATDPDGDDVAIRFAWGDGDTSDWSAFVSSGQNITLEHSWSTAGTYSVKAQAKDVNGAISGWSSGHQITISSGGGYPNHIVATIPVGYAPWAVTALPNGNYVYVMNRGDYDVSVIQTSNNSVVALIPVGSEPVNACALPNSQYVYVTNYVSNNVSVIQTSNNTVVATIPVGVGPGSAVALPNGNYVYVVNMYGYSVSVIQTSNNSVVATIPVGAMPHDITVLPNGEYVYLTNRDDDNVSVIRTSDNTVVATVPVGDAPDGIIAHPNGNYVYAINRGGNSVSVIKTSNNTVETTFPLITGPINVDVLPNGEYLYITNGNVHTVSVVRTSDNTVVTSISASGGPLGVAALSNGQYVYITRWDIDAVSVIGQ